MHGLILRDRQFILKALNFFILDSNRFPQHLLSAILIALEEVLLTTLLHGR